MNATEEIFVYFFLDSSTADLDLETFRQMCRRHDIPIPQPNLFSRWAFVLTTGVQSAHSDHFYLDSDDPVAKNQCMSRFFIFTAFMILSALILGRKTIRIN